MKCFKFLAGEKAKLNVFNKQYQQIKYFFELIDKFVTTFWELGFVILLKIAKS